MEWIKNFRKKIDSWLTQLITHISDEMEKERKEEEALEN